MHRVFVHILTILILDTLKVLLLKFHPERMEAYGSIWKHVEAYGSIWKHVEAYGSIWKHMEAYGSM